MYSQIDDNKRRTWILLIVFVAVIAAVGWLLGQVTDYGNGLVIFALIFSALGGLFSYYSGDKVALWSAGAQAIKKEDSPYVYRLVENLCLSSGLPLPQIYLITDNSINAFATGRDPQHAAIAITTGAVAKLENEELEGVIAHELSHIKNYDIRLMMVVIILVGTVALVADWFWRLNFLGGRRNNNENRGGNAWLIVVGLIFILLSPLVAKLIQLAVSRKREYLADASGSLLTRYPEGLARALEKIKNDNQPLARASTATAHLYIANPLAGSGRRLAGLFSTHPPLTDRIAKLRGMTD